MSHLEFKKVLRGRIHDVANLKAVKGNNGAGIRLDKVPGKATHAVSETPCPCPWHSQPFHQVDTLENYELRLPDRKATLEMLLLSVCFAPESLPSFEKVKTTISHHEELYSILLCCLPFVADLGCVLCFVFININNATSSISESITLGFHFVCFVKKEFFLGV